MITAEALRTDWLKLIRNPYLTYLPSLTTPRSFYRRRRPSHATTVESPVCHFSNNVEKAFQRKDWFKVDEIMEMFMSHASEDNENDESEDGD